VRAIPEEKDERMKCKLTKMNGNGEREREIG
jgi:hypothetical protein